MALILLAQIRLATHEYGVLRRLKEVQAKVETNFQRGSITESERTLLLSLIAEMEDHEEHHARDREE